MNPNDANDEKWRTFLERAQIVDVVPITDGTRGFVTSLAGCRSVQVAINPDGVHATVTSRKIERQ